MAKTIQPPMLTGLSLEDRELMLVMMAALGSAAQTMMKASQYAADTMDIDNNGQELGAALDAEANSIIDICKRAKDRLKPGSAILVN